MDRAVTEPRSRAMILFATEEAPPPIQRFTAGRLSAMIDRGNLRAIAWDGIEVLRAISFIVRDSNWGTYAPAIEDLVTETAADRFEIRYAAACDGPEGDFGYRTRIVGSADGTLSFEATGRSTRGFRTNRTGFVVLHGLDGVVGKLVEVEHASGGRSAAVFPMLVSGSQPIFDIRALTHEPRPSLIVSVRMEGDAFEMEDQRNWTDASFKTYVRPLARGYPYEIAPEEAIEQSVTVRIVDGVASERSSPIAFAPAVIPAKAGTYILQLSTVRDHHRLESMGPGFRRDDGLWGEEGGSERHATVTIGGAVGIMPAIGLALDPAIPLAETDFASIGRWAMPNYLVVRIDATAPALSSLSPNVNSGLPELTHRELDAGKSRRGGLRSGRTGLFGTYQAEKPPPNPPPQGERAKREDIDLASLTRLGAFCAKAGIGLDLDIVGDGSLQTLADTLSSIGLAPTRILLVPPDHATVRRAFPTSQVVAGTLVGFPELNRNRPLPGFDVIAHSTQAIVHAADDLSVMETIEALPDVIATARSFAPGARYRIGPATIGAPAAFYAARPAQNTTGSRMTAAEPDPRQQGLFAAAFALGYAATVAGEGIDAVTLSLAEGPHGIGAGNDACPIAAIVDGLAGLAGHARLATAVSDKSVAAVAAATDAGSELWLANLTGQSVTVAVTGAVFSTVRLIDAPALKDRPASEIGFEACDGIPVTLDAYAVLCLRQGNRRR